MKRVFALLIALGFVAGVASTAHAVVLIDGALNNGYLDETLPQEAVPGFFVPKPTVWINQEFKSASGAYGDGMSSESWAGPAPTPVTNGDSGFPFPDGCGGPDCGVFFKPFSGSANDLANVNLYQDNPGTPGMKYILTGWAGAEANAMMQGAEIALEFLDAGNLVIGGDVVNLLPTLFVANGQPFNYKQYMAMAVAPIGTATVRARASMIGAMANPAGGGQAFVVDDFRLECVPEPASLALLGLAAFGLVGIRRRSM